MNTGLRVISALAIVGLLLAACGGGAAPTPTTEAAATLAPAVTQASVVTQAPATASVTRCLQVALSISSGETNSLDPIAVPTTEQAVMINQVYNRLMDVDSTFVVHPELADSWESNSAATEWTFHLHKNVKFSDGRDFTANDVVWTYKRLIDPKTGSEAAATLAFLKADGIIAVDPLTVKFTTDKPVPELPLLITTKNTWIVPDGSTSETLKLKGVGTGPFIPVDFQPVQQPHKFVRNPNYWQAGLPKSDCVDFYVIQEPTTRVGSIQSGQVDIVEYVDFSTIPTLTKDTNIKLLTTGASTTITFSMWVDTPPFKDLRVRQALKKLIDRKAMVDTVLLGYGVIGDDNPIPPTSPFAWRTDVPPRDLEGAKALLAAAGYSASKPLKIDLYAADFLPGVTSLAQMFKEQAAGGGCPGQCNRRPAGGSLG